MDRATALGSRAGLLGRAGAPATRGDSGDQGCCYARVGRRNPRSRGLSMTFDRKRSKGDSDGGKTHLEISAHGPGIDDYGKMQQRAPIETSDSGTETAKARPTIPTMMPLNQ